MSTYKVTLPTTNCLNDTAMDGEKYITVEHGVLYVTARDAADVGRRFPKALAIVRVGVGLALPVTP